MTVGRPLSKARRVDAALSEVGWPGAVNAEGYVRDRKVPPLLLYQAWVLATGSDNTFAEWVARCITNTTGGDWRSYFRSHNVAIEGKP